MRCPCCDNDVLHEFLGDEYETIYVCEFCGCEFKYSIKILKEGKQPEDDEELTLREW
jgi:Predicted ATPase involved in replication control, Cdc46/Mcm family